MVSNNHDIFLSYAHANNEFALQLADDLRASGANIWVYELDVSPGERWDSATERALEKCQCLMVVLSPESVASDIVMDEVAFALREKKQIIPILFRDCKIPFRLERIKRIDFSADYNSGLMNVIKIFKLETSSSITKPMKQKKAVSQNNIK